MSGTSSSRSPYRVHNLASPPEVPMWCPLCSSSIGSSTDEEAFRRRKCCRNCEDDIVEKNIVRWNDGWRPAQEEVQAAVRKRNELETQRYYLLYRRSDGR